MDKEVKAKWIEALESGKYEQARRRLRKGAAFCCLGVLCDQSPGVEWAGNTAIYKGVGAVGMPPVELPEDIGLKLDDADTLSRMNDRGSTFPEIAAYIRENL